MSSLKIHLTYWCTAQCGHCRFGCMRRPAPVIDEGLVMECARELLRLNNLDTVVLLGGEPGLAPDLTHRLAVGLGQMGLKVRVETNASWATSDEKAREFLAPLYAAGASVMFSLDAWHEPFVPPERVLRAARVTEELGGDYYVESAYLNYARRDRPQDRRTDELLAGLEAAVSRPPKVYRGTILYNGRAAKKLAGLVSAGRGVPAATCDQVPWWYNGQLATLDLLELDPDGYLSKGCGIAVADLRKTSVAELAAGYDAAQHPLFATLMREGPLGLAREAQEYGYVIKEDYADKCQLCQEAREYLRPRYPEYLVPDQHYIFDWS